VEDYVLSMNDTLIFPFGFTLVEYNLVTREKKVILLPEKLSGANRVVFHDMSFGACVIFRIKFIASLFYHLFLNP
jgi:hypothetical protein